MATASTPLAEQELKFRVVYNSQSLNNSEPIGLAIDAKGVFLAIAFKNFVLVYECSESSVNEAQENWALKCTYDLQDSGASINSISWASTGVLAVAFDTGDVSLALLDSRETILEGFQVSNKPVKMVAMEEQFRFIAVVAGVDEIGIWRFLPVVSRWVPLNYIEPFRANSEESVEVISVQWDSHKNGVLIAGYSNGDFVKWTLDLDHDEATPVLIATIENQEHPIRDGVLATDGTLLVHPHAVHCGRFYLHRLLTAPTQRVLLECIECSEKLNPLTSFVFMFGSTWLLAPGVGHVHLWHVETSTLATRISMGPSYTAYRASHLSACGLLAKTESEMYNLKIAAYTTSTEPGGPSSIIIWKAFVRSNPNEACVRVTPQGDLISQLGDRRSGAWILILMILFALVLAYITSSIR